MATTTTSFDKLIADLQKQQTSANLANQKRYDQMLAIYDEVINRYQPGGAFQKAGLAEIGKQKVQDIGQETQQMIGSGLYGTTTTASLPSRWESNVGAKARLNLEDVMLQRLSGAQVGKAGAIENVSDTGPGYDLIAQLAMQSGQGYGGGGSSVIPSSQGFLPPGGSSGQSLNDWLQSNFPQYGELRGPSGTGFATVSGGGGYNLATNKSLIGQPTPLGAGTQQSTFDQPPSWTGNYRDWKAKMDAYNKSKGLSLSGY